ncbi:FAD-dependent oxidoreductase [Symmachiella dynata]|uniref:FAD-dependent oxidoreductase n=1 Tax=Symmachiella dynata TaxID=2527995 RepID=UPI0030EB4CE0
MKTGLGIVGFLFAAILLVGANAPAEAPVEKYDVVVYGGTSGGVVAAVQAARMGKSVLLIEPGRHLGGLTAGGLGATDIGNKAAIGGLSRDFYRKLGTHYAQSESWNWQKREEFRSRRKGNETEMWTFEPHVAEQTFRDWLAEYKIPVRFEERLDLQNGVNKTDAHIDTIVMESGLQVAANVFIDATYEGDLLAVAGVSYHVGRESNTGNSQRWPRQRRGGRSWRAGLLLPDVYHRYSRKPRAVDEAGRIRSAGL